MAEEKSAPKKEKAPKAAVAAAGAEAPLRLPSLPRPPRPPEAAAPEARRRLRPLTSPLNSLAVCAKQPTAEDLLKEELGAIKVRKAKGSKNVTSGVANVLATFNNTIVSITDQKGQRHFLVQRRQVQLPRFAQVHRLCRPGCRAGRRPQCHVPRPQGHCHPRVRSRSRSRQRHPCAAGHRPWRSPRSWTSPPSRTTAAARASAVASKPLPNL
jgi:hypothetical protein